MSINKFESWMWSYLGIIVEALPFLLIGAVLSAVIQIYLSDDLIKKIISKSTKTKIIGNAVIKALINSIFTLLVGIFA